MRPQRFTGELQSAAAVLQRALLLIWFLAAGGVLHRVVAQAPAEASVEQKIETLTSAMARAQSQLEASERELQEIRLQLSALERQLAQADATKGVLPAASPSTAEVTPAMGGAVDDVRDRLAMQESQIKVHEQTKVESESRYPVKINGLLLLNGFANMRGVDMPGLPTLAIGGAASTGASVRQTVLGVDAAGPHLFGASSHADLRVDFDGMPGSGSSAAPTYSIAYSANATLLRLRTAHAVLDWPHAQAFWALDRPILSPDAPTSLTAVAEPELAWSGNLWAWNPQVGVRYDLRLAATRRLRVEAALIDPADAPLSSTAYQSSVGSAPSSSEQSRWPGTEARIALLGSRADEGARLGVGGYFSPHRTSDGDRFNAWAATLDYRLPLPARLQLTGSAYRGLALGGLGAGAYKDYLYRVSRDGTTYYYRPFDDIGGWTQLKERFSGRVEANVAFGVDELFAGQLRPYAYSANPYQNLERNRTFMGNVIYSPSAYLLFSLEFRRLDSLSATGTNFGSNIIGLAAGYKF